VFWPETQSGDMVTHLAHHARMPTEPVASSIDPAAYAQAMGLEAEPVRLTGGEVEAAVRTLAPGFVRIAGRGYLAVAAVSSSRLKILTPELRLESISINEAAKLIRSEAAAIHQSKVEQLVDRCGITGAKRQRAIDSVIDERLRGKTVGLAWQLRQPPGSDFVHQLREAGIPDRTTYCG